MREIKEVKAVLFLSRCLIYLAAACFCLVNNGYASEQASVYYLDLHDLMNTLVTTASKVSQKASDVPGTIYVVSKQQIANRGYRNLAQLLEDIPEIEIQHKSVAEFNNYYSIRGIAGNDKIVVLLYM